MKKSTQSAANGSVQETLPSQFEDEYQVAAQEEINAFTPATRTDKPPCWMEEPVGDLYPIPPLSVLPESPPRQPSKLPPAIMATQLDACFDNLKRLACSGGANRFLACRKELLSLESRWRQEFGEHHLRASHCDQFESSPPTANNVYPNEPISAKRRKRQTPVRQPVWDFPDIPNPSAFNQPGAEFLDRPPWFLD